MSKNKVAIALSGGVDSAVSAFLLKKQGYEVYGFYLNLLSDEEKLNKVKKIADFLNIPLEIVDAQDEFREKVINYFLSEYLSGKTPNPCVICNSEIKINFLIKIMGKMGINKFATGHYADITEFLGQYYIKPASREKDKSQDYFLAFLKNEQISKLIFPLRNLTKKEAIEIALNEKIPVELKESQDICFLNGKSYVDYIIENTDYVPEPGIVEDTSGKFLGYHRGYVFYTIGQRKGLGISKPYPLYVVKIDAKNNKIIVGSREEILKSYIRVKLRLWREGVREGEFFVRIRYKHSPTLSFVKIKDFTAEVHFNEAQFAPTPGQIAVFYSKDFRITGAGFIL